MIFAFLFVTTSAFGQSNLIEPDTKERNSPEIAVEMRLTRQLVQQLVSDSRRIQIAAIKIRVHQDAINKSEARLDAIREKISDTQSDLEMNQEQIKFLEAMKSGADKDQPSREFTETRIAEAKSRGESLQQKLDALRVQDQQLIQDIQSDKARLAELLASLDEKTSARVSQNSGITRRAINYILTPRTQGHVLPNQR